MKRFLLHAVILLGLGVAAGAAVVGFGLYDVSARRGHLPGVSWLLHTAYRNAVELYAPPASAVPDLSSEALAALGAGHYDGACRMCHGAPGAPQTDTVRAMVPHPPPIAEAVAHWQPQHLFWIVKHGVKMTGMPAWPSERRDDDVWAVVAFLVRDEGMDETTYRALLARAGQPSGDEGPEPRGLAYCATCHGADGTGGGNPFIPRLDIQNAEYLAASLRAFRSDLRQSGIMQHAASSLGDAQIEALAAHYGGSTPAPQQQERRQATDARVARGRELAFSGSNRTGVPACRACHGPWPSKRSPLFPNLAGQHETWLLQQLRLWKAGRRGGTARANLMHKVVPELGEPEMRALAAYYASLSAGAASLHDAPPQ